MDILYYYFFNFKYACGNYVEYSHFDVLDMIKGVVGGGRVEREAVENGFE